MIRQRVTQKSNNNAGMQRVQRPGDSEPTVAL